MSHASFVSYNCNMIPCSKIKSRIYQTKSGGSYTILNYDKDFICFDESDEIKQCRSVIYSHPGHNLLSYSPGQSITNNSFTDQFDYKWSDIYVNEFIEGLMINLFYDYRYNKWEIATKGAVGGEYGFFSKNVSKQKCNQTILSMFVDAFCTKGNKIMNIEALAYFSKQYSYSFVLRHPDNPIIYPIQFASLYLVAVYDINRKDRSTTSIPHGIFQSWAFLQNTPILFPRQLLVNESNDLHKHLSVIDDNTKTIPGYVATHMSSGKRSIFYHPTYTSMLKLFKVDPHFVYHYLCLRRMDLVKAYVVAVPTFRKMFYRFKEHCDEFIENLHTAYLVKFVWRNEKKVSNKYDKYATAIHREIYIPSISKTRVTITRKVIRDYVMSKPPGEILYSLFYEKRILLRPK